MNVISLANKFNKLLDRKQKKNIIFLFFIMVVGAFLETLGVSLMVPLINVIMNSQSEINTIIKRVGILLIIYILKNIFLYFEYIIRAKYVFDNKFETKKLLFSSMLHKPYEYFLNTSTGEILRKLNSDVDQTYSLLLHILSLISELFVSIALIITIFIIDPIMTSIISIVLIVTIVLISTFVKPRLTKKGNEFRLYNSQMYKWILQTVQGIKEIKIAKKEEFFENMFNDVGIKSSESSKKEYVLSSTPKTIIEIVCVCSTLITVVILILNGKTSDELIPTLGAFAMAAIRLMPTSNKIIGLTGAIAYEGPAIDSLLKELKDVSYKNEEPKENYNIIVKDSIELKNISYHYPNNSKNILNNVSLNIPVSSSVGIKGKSGIGKTTLIDIILGLLKQNKGNIKVGGVNINETNSDWLSHIGYVPQSIFLLDDSIKNNIIFGNALNEQRLIDCLKEAQLYEFVKTLDEKENTFVGERGIRLSGGQKQRIGIARALYKNPEILIFDEATSSLDNETEQAIIESINNLRGKKTIIIVAHRLETIKKCDFIVEIK